jgi:hypothetical protein
LDRWLFLIAAPPAMSVAVVVAVSTTVAIPGDSIMDTKGRGATDIGADN